MLYCLLSPGAYLKNHSSNAFVPLFPLSFSNIALFSALLSSNVFCVPTHCKLNLLEFLFVEDDFLPVL